jgi:alkylated DNA nucleotide flippase Atl1
MRTKKSWKEKLGDSKGLPKVGSIEGKMSARWGTGTMVIPSPTEVNAIMREVPSGKIITINEIRALLASKHNVTIGCPITTGIFAWIAANAAAEEAAAGVAQVTPYWRTLRSGGELNPKYPGGIAGMRARLEAEGHTIIKKGKRFFVANFDKALCNPSQFKKPIEMQGMWRPRAQRHSRALPQARASA